MTPLLQHEYKCAKEYNLDVNLFTESGMLVKALFKYWVRQWVTLNHLNTLLFFKHVKREDTSNSFNNVHSFEYLFQESQYYHKGK